MTALVRQGNQSLRVSVALFFICDDNSDGGKAILISINKFWRIDFQRPIIVTHISDHARSLVDFAKLAEHHDYFRLLLKINLIHEHMAKLPPKRISWICAKDAF